MPLGLVIFALIIGFAGTALFTIVRLEGVSEGYSADFGRTPLFIFSIIFYISFTWMLIFSQQEWKIKKTLCLKPTDVNGTQVIAISCDDGVRLINVNKKFSKSFLPHQTFTVKIYERGPYAGLYCEKTVLDIKPDTIKEPI